MHSSRSLFRILCEHQIRTSAWAGSGYGGTLRPLTITGPGQLRGEPDLHGWDKYMQLVAEAYREAPLSTGAGTKSFIALKQHILNMFTRIQSRVRVEFVDRDPYESAEEMQQKVKETGILQISNLFNQSDAFGPEVNLMLRAVHDFSAHLGANPKSKPRTFSLKGELQAYNKHLALVGAKSHAAAALYTEIVGQGCHFWYFGNFPVQKIVTLPQFDWVHLGKVAGFRIVDGDLVA